MGRNPPPKCGLSQSSSDSSELCRSSDSSLGSQRCSGMTNWDFESENKRLHARGCSRPRAALRRCGRMRGKGRENSCWEFQGGHFHTHKAGCAALSSSPVPTLHPAAIPWKPGTHGGEKICTEICMDSSLRGAAHREWDFGQEFPVLRHPPLHLPLLCILQPPNNNTNDLHSFKKCD